MSSKSRSKSNSLETFFNRNWVGITACGTSEGQAYGRLHEGSMLRWRAGVPQSLRGEVDNPVGPDGSSRLHRRDWDEGEGAGGRRGPNSHAKHPVAHAKSTTSLATDVETPSWITFRVKLTYGSGVHHPFGLRIAWSFERGAMPSTEAP